MVGGGPINPDVGTWQFYDRMCAVRHSHQQVLESVLEQLDAAYAVAAYALALVRLPYVYAHQVQLCHSVAVLDGARHQASASLTHFASEARPLQLRVAKAVLCICTTPWHIAPWCLDVGLLEAW